MNPSELRLMRHLGWVVALKLLVLAGLWQAFMADQRVAVDDASVAAHVGGAAASSAGTTAMPAPPHQGAHP